LELSDIPTVLLTHLHYDHAGGCDQLPPARFILQRTELMAAAPMGPKELDIGGKDLFFDRKDVAGLVDDCRTRSTSAKGTSKSFPASTAWSIPIRSDRIFPAHDTAIAPEQLPSFGE
jgi:ribonuclease BN (tRNA processing enzyme)